MSDQGDVTEPVNFTVKLVGPSGKSSRYAVLVGEDKWVIRECPPGTVAMEDADGRVRCDFPPRSEAPDDEWEQ